jgi:hypothetical protein
MQSRVVDRLIRLFFELPTVRQVLDENQKGQAFGESVSPRSERARGWVKDAKVTGEGTERLVPLLSSSELQAYRAELQRDLEPVLTSIITRMSKNVPQIPDRGQHEWDVFRENCRLYLTAAATFATVAEEEDVSWATRFLESRASRRCISSSDRGFVASSEPQSVHAEPFTKRLERFSADLEHVPESEATMLLDQFMQLVDIWMRPQISPREHQKESTASEEQLD